MSKLRKAIRPRDYQLETIKWALDRDGTVVVMPTGPDKTLIAAPWIKELISRGVVKRVLVLEPTRILVEQTAKYICEIVGAKAVPIHGETPKSKRVSLWKKALMAVATPETELSDHNIVVGEGFDWVVVDECHHTTGKDAYAESMRRTIFRKRLGLSAYIPRSRWPEIEKHIGEIRVWSWRDKRIRKHVPPWIGGIYEAELNDAEKKVLEALEETIEWSMLVGFAH